MEENKDKKPAYDLKYLTYSSALEIMAAQMSSKEGFSDTDILVHCNN
jgi:hypothetical protein